MAVAAGLSLMVPAAASAAAHDASTRRPNIILFMVDDMGWQDTSLPFWKEKTPYNEMFRTPNMERLADRGMKFTQAYACSVSSPSRVSLITGANAARHKVTNWTLRKDESTDIKSDEVTTAGWNINGASRVTGLDATFVSPSSFVDELRKAGYHTIHCGKAHFGAIGTPGENPCHWGFETNIAGHGAGGLATYLSENNFGHRADGTPYAFNAIPDLERYWGTGIFATEALTREAIKELDRAKGYNQPFFLYMSHYAVHIPVDRDKRFYDDYIRRGYSPKEAAYASLVEGMDKSLGDIMDWVEKNGEADNTVIIFMSDNGGLASAPRWRDGTPDTQNAPLSSGKGSLNEGGIRVPMIVSWPGIVTPASECSDYLIIEDFYPTILEIGGVKRYDRSNVDGISFMPMLRQKGSTSPGRPLVWNFPNVWGNNGRGINLNCAIRKDDWKLVYYYLSGRKELYNIPRDIGETRDLAADRPDIVRKLSVELGRILRQRGATRPVLKSTGMPCPWPDEVK